MRKIIGISAMVVSSFLAACGGGGGSPGDTKLPYSITLRAEKVQLPLNISNLPAGIGAYAPYTTTLYVEAREDDKPILGGDFGCNVSGGLNSGSLVYLDGKSEHQDKDGNANHYRSITLGANSGGNSFHFHAGDQAGTARITCTITNPADQQVSSASVDIVVGAATGLPASVIASAQAPGYLGSRDNLDLIRNNVVIQAFVMDDANQPVPTPNAANLQVRILQSSASAGSRLISGAQSSGSIHVRTIGGVGEISLSSGPSAGGILLEFATDRHDNDVSNGIQDPVISLFAVGVFDVEPNLSNPLTITTDTVAPAEQNVSYHYLLSAKGGRPAYRWASLGGLPAGLSLGSSGIIQGTPSVAGTFSFVAQVTDAAGLVVTGNFTIEVKAAPPPPPAALVITGCSGAGVCQLSPAPAGSRYVYAFSATGGDPEVDLAWEFNPAMPASWLTAGAAGQNGVITGTPPSPMVDLAECNVTFLVTATRGKESVSRTANIKVTGGGCPAP